MNINQNSRKKFIHLYNPKKEGLGLYDVNYINAYKKNKILKGKLNQNTKKRFAA